MRVPACLAAALSIAIACDRRHEAPSPAVAATSNSSSTIAASPSASSTAIDLGSTKLLDDAEVGPLIARLSERPGSFPSDNYVTNETSYLDVEDALADPKLHGRAYVGVGPEQNLTYLAWLEPAVAYIVDIRRGNLLEWMMLRGCFEAGATRLGFLRALVAREPIGISEAEAQSAPFSRLASSFPLTPRNETLRKDGLARTSALMKRLGVEAMPEDAAQLERIHLAFADLGLELAYSMTGSFRQYPTLGETLGEKDGHGVEASFLASEEAYARVRRIILENRVIPVVGDFGGTHALRAVADDARARGLLLGAFYTSNVEQYLFDAHTYDAFVDSVKAMPRDDASTIVRVWFDQGRSHPLQRPGNRTTQLAMNANAFLARAAKKAFVSYWEVVNP